MDTSVSTGVVLYRREPVPHFVRERHPGGPHDSPPAGDVQDDCRPPQGTVIVNCLSFVLVDDTRLSHAKFISVWRGLRSPNQLVHTIQNKARL